MATKIKPGDKVFFCIAGYMGGCCTKIHLCGKWVRAKTAQAARRKLRVELEEQSLDVGEIISLPFRPLGTRHPAVHAVCFLPRGDRKPRASGPRPLPTQEHP